MKLFLLLAAAALFAGVLCVTAFADEGTDALVAAGKAVTDAPAVRLKATSTGAPGGLPATVMTLEIVNPDGMHMKSEAGGAVQMELVTDGKKVFMSQGGGKLTEAPAQMAAMMKQARAQFSGDAVAKMAHNVKLVGHETVDGVAASVYTYDTDMMGLHSVSKEWISDKDHRPLKVEGETKGNLQTGGQPGQAVDMKTLATFEYDPSIKVTLPAS